MWRVLAGLLGCLSIGAAISSLPDSTSASTLSVPGDHPTIQAAIDAASSGDTIVVAPGTYFENINFNGKAIEVRSASGPALTIINGSQIDAAARFVSGESTSSILRGFTLTRGGPYPTQYSEYGGGIQVANSSPLIEGNHIVENVSCGGGGGIGVNNGSPVIRGNFIARNSDCDGGIGGSAIAVLGPLSSPLIEGNLLEEGSSAAAGGPALTLFQAGSPQVIGNVIRNNPNSFAYFGGVWVEYTTATLANNLIIGAYSDRGAVYASAPPGPPTLRIINNTIVDNNAPFGIYLAGSDQGAQIFNNIVVASTMGDGIHCSSLSGSPNPPVLRNNNIHAPTGIGYEGGCSVFLGLDGNVSTDPEFVSTVDGDFRLRLTSPSIDAGDNAAPGLPPTDLDQSLRFRDGNGDAVVTVDQGAFEFDAAATPTATFEPTSTTPTGTSTPTSTAITTPTQTPYPAPDVSLMIDCDVAIPGVQSACDVSLGSSDLDVDVYVLNNSRRPFNVSAFNSTVVNPNRSRLDALPSPPCASPGYACNPDFDEAALSLGSWSCGPPFPRDDSEPGARELSWLSCFSSRFGPVLPPGQSLRIFRVHYSLVPGAGVGVQSLSLESTSLFDELGTERVSCGPPTPTTGTCFPAQLNFVQAPAGTPTPWLSATPSLPPGSPTSTPTSSGVSSSPTATPTSSFFLAVDCDTSLPGLQLECSYPLNARIIRAGIVLYNNSAQDLTVGAFDLKVLNSDTSRLSPLPGADSNLDGNPNFDELALGTIWNCFPPGPIADTGAGGPGTTTSQITCVGGAPFTSLLAGASKQLVHVDFSIQQNALPGQLSLSPHPPLSDVAVYGWTAGTLAECGEGHALAMPCLPATITLVGPVIGKLPEGNAYNTNLSVPSANLWICQLGPCSGAGEGALRVLERAYGVQDGLGAYEFSVEYDNFVIASVNPCDLVFGPGGAGSARGPVDEVDAAAVNTDCSPDPGPGGSSCTMSHILENVVHFGCATAGQTPGPTGDMDLASLLLIPHEDLTNDLFPGNENGVLTIIKDNGCELVDVLGHPVTGSVNGGLVPECGDLAITVRILEGDLDLNCVVDVTDAQLIAGRYGGFFGSLTYTKWYDLEPALHDLDIDIKDLQKVFGRDGSTCQVPVPAQPPLGPPVPFP